MKYFNTNFYNIAFVHYYYSVIGFCTACARKESKVWSREERTEGNCHGRIFQKELLLRCI